VKTDQDRNRRCKPGLTQDLQRQNLPDSFVLIGWPKQGTPPINQPFAVGITATVLGSNNSAVIDGGLEKIPTEHRDKLQTLMTHNYQTFDPASFLAACKDA
jgi:hypothetical protein